MYGWLVTTLFPLWATGLTRRQVLAGQATAFSTRPSTGPPRAHGTTALCHLGLYRQTRRRKPRDVHAGDAYPPRQAPLWLCPGAFQHLLRDGCLAGRTAGVGKG